MSAPGPRVVAELTWLGEGLRFHAVAQGHELVVDGDGATSVSPVQALAIALASCMASDVVHILVRGRQPLRSLRARLEGERCAEEPRRLVAVHLRFELSGAVSHDKVTRAIALSREKYCSVWHSLRPDIDFRTSFASEP